MSDEVERKVELAIRRAIELSGSLARPVADLPFRDIARAAIAAMVFSPAPLTPASRREYKACLGCRMGGGRHDPGCPYEGKTHLPKPRQEGEDDFW